MKRVKNMLRSVDKLSGLVEGYCGEGDCDSHPVKKGKRKAVKKVMMKEGMSERASLLETTYNTRPMSVDTENGVIYNVKLLGRESKHGRTYSDQALSDARRMYEGMGVNIDHPSAKDVGKERSVTEGLGEIRNPVIKPDGVYGDFHYNREHAFAKPLAEAAQRFPGQLGFSHNAEGKVVRQGGKSIVESIYEVRSVDLVRYPATNRGLFESENRTMTTIRAVLEESDEGADAVASLLEMDPAGFGPMLDAPMAAPAPGASEEEADPATRMKAALRELVIIAFDEETDAKTTLNKIRRILNVQDDLLGVDVPSSDLALEDEEMMDEEVMDEEPVDEEEMSEEPIEEEEPVEESNKKQTKRGKLAESKLMKVLESVNTELQQVKAKLTESETSQSAKQLIESLHRKATDERIRLVAKLPAADRKGLVESWPQDLGPDMGRRPHVVPLRESGTATGTYTRTKPEDFARKYS